MPKDSSNWSIVTGEAIGVLFYSMIGDEFGYEFHAGGLDDIDYSLIYYGDTEDRYNDWGGDSPGRLIAYGTAVGGELNLSDSVELDTSLPAPSDANGYFYDYAESDGYCHPIGAKIWLVPSSCYDEPEVITWSPDDFLFETDLIFYIDTNA